MRPRRSTTIEGNRIEEFYWYGKYIVYVNDHLDERPYDQVVEVFTNRYYRGGKDELPNS